MQRCLKMNFVLNSEIATPVPRLEQEVEPTLGKQHTQTELSEGKLHVSVATALCSASESKLIG